MRAVVDAVAGMLRAAGVGDVFCIAPSALLSEQPVVVRWAGFSRESRQDGEERGVASVEVFAVRETDAAAYDVAILCEAAVRSSGRSEWNAEGSGVRILGIDTDAPTFRERDSSGRFVWAFTVRLTVAREI
ncbi:hypothetical protein [Collinsella sp. An307]|uniref:hypothetical protein n=1 Tax=Collinsella sp. An307 TaxID=1965630 RepID=UPI000B3AB4ED|nr:hypothetical protein [Collinsella sp. An307]OUO18841.1 hypothetical protein B5F89_09125 [Collinsella sp. An307]